ncbi:matrix-remodeling-associated protein 7-like isoform X2 [Pollicipes pollicipes]|nr:matrix-remodeling-associated protein 7-like isoform X2 [Pollicipes pollicipes]
MMTCVLMVVTVTLGGLYTLGTGLSAGRQAARRRAEDTGSEAELQEPSSTTSPSADADEPLSLLVDTTEPLPPGRLKRAERDAMRRRLEQDMTDEQKRQERQSESEQMAAILDLMQKNSDKFGNPSLEDMQSQMRLYL